MAYFGENFRVFEHQKKKFGILKMTIMFRMHAGMGEYNDPQQLDEVILKII